MTHIDWTQSNATAPFSDQCLRFDGAVASNGGTRYLPKTDGRRNPCFERLVYTLSPRCEDVLPRIPNPVSPWKHITGTHLWSAHGAGNRERDGAFWRQVHRWGMRRMVVTDHETGWRDHEESFTFRLHPAPGKGGDRGQYDYARLMQDELGFIYGPYNNFTDFAPVNGFWHIDLINRTPDNQLQRAWRRCYAPKPTRAVEFCERLTPQIQSKFHFSTAYCDVHTAVTPWSRVDYDPRVPGAGTFAAVFYAYGEIMLLQKAAWQGPVYSEGNNHFPYCGLTDGNYAQDQAYRIAENPWLVDFDLRRLHELCCNFGMGHLGMFYNKSPPADKEVAVDRFLAATVAFGHPGFLIKDRPFDLRSYYMLQALAALYTQSAPELIRYADAAGDLWESSAALANGAYLRSQVVTRYADKTVTAVNGHAQAQMRIALEEGELTLPPNGYWGSGAEGRVKVFSGEVNGHRADLALAPEYTYLDGRGIFTRFPEGATAGQAICRATTGDLCEILLRGTTEAGFPFACGEAVALDQTNGIMGVAQVREARGLSYVQPVAGATSYLVRRLPQQPQIRLHCARSVVRPGDEVEITGKQNHKLRIPAAAKAGERLWYALEQGWIDFTVATETPAALETAAAAGLPLPQVYGRGMLLRSGGETALDPASGASIQQQRSVCGAIAKDAIFMHPPYRCGPGAAFARYALDLESCKADFLQGSIGKRDRSALGDGILFKVVLEDSGKVRHELMRQLVSKHQWQDFQADLRPWRGQQVALLLIADVGENDNSVGDWAAWGELRLTRAALEGASTGR